MQGTGEEGFAPPCVPVWVSTSPCVRECVCVMRRDSYGDKDRFGGVGVLSQLGQGKRTLPGTVPCGAFLWRPGDPSPFPTCVLSS